MEIILQLLLVFAIARGLGVLAERLGQPPAIGEILAGIALAIAILVLGSEVPFLAALTESDALRGAAELGIFFLVLHAGIEMEPRDMAKSSPAAFAVAIGGTLLPLFGGFWTAWMLLPESHLLLGQSLAIGITLSISAVPAIIKVLMDLGLLETRIGQVVVTTAVLDDILGLILLAILFSMLENGGLPDEASILWLLLKVSIFFAITILLGVHVYPRLSKTVAEVDAVALELSVLVAVALAYGALAEGLGLHWIMGPFMAGLFFERSRVGGRPYDDMKLLVAAITSGVLAPVFFATIGLQVAPAGLVDEPLLLVVLVVVAITIKVIGSGVPARILGFDARSALELGVAMSARGGVGLVVVSIAFEHGFLGPGEAGERLFSIMVTVIILTTLVAPIWLRRLLKTGSST